jgi:hypothetical protein
MYNGVTNSVYATVNASINTADAAPCEWASGSSRVLLAMSPDCRVPNLRYTHKAKQTDIS